MAAQAKSLSLFDPTILGPAVGDAFKKLDPRTLRRNPVMFVVEIVSAATTVLFVRDLLVGSGASFSGQISLWLWFTVLFANFAEAVAEGRGKAQAASLRRTQSQAIAKRLGAANAANWQDVPAHQLKVGDIVLVEAGDLIPSDGEIIEGIASVDESAITGESAPVPDRVAYAVMFLRMAATETRKLAEDNLEIARELLHIADELRGEAHALAGQINE